MVPSKTSISGGGTYSNAPISTVLLTIRSNPTPRWSVVNPVALALFPVSIPGLPANKAWVKLKPPLSCKGPNLASKGLLAVPTKLLAGNVVSTPLLSPIKFPPPSIQVPPAISGFLTSVDKS